MIADPICSIFIAILIALSVGSLVSESAAVLMQRQPKELDKKLPEAYNKVRGEKELHLFLTYVLDFASSSHYMFLTQILQLEGVQGVQETHFWTLCTDYYVGGLKLEVAADADQKYVVSHTQMIFRGIGVSQLFVQLDFEHSNRTYQNLQNFYK